MNWYQKTVNEVLISYKVDAIHGLLQEQVEDHLKRYGSNIIQEKPKDSLVKIFLQQFQNPLIYILLLSAALIFFVGEYLDAFIISGILFFNALIGTMQEGRTSSILESLKRYLVTESLVVRNGIKQIIPSQDLVVGDIIVVQAGEQVCADARLLQVNHLEVDESMLTGESISIFKTVEPLNGNVPVHDQKNMIFKGTSLIAGNALAIVVAVGAETQLGKLNKTIENIQTDLPLRKQLDALAHHILMFSIVLCSFLFIMGLLLGKSFNELLVMLTALFICVVPEGLPVVFTLALVSGAWRMAKNYVLVKKLQAVEGLGLVDIIMMDKTGTLTANQMIVSTVICNHHIFTVTGQGYFPQGKIIGGVSADALQEELYPLAVAVSLLNSSVVEFDEKQQIFLLKGDSTDAALHVFAQKFGITAEKLKHYKTVYQIPFDVKKRIKIGFFNNNTTRAFLQGAPEAVLARCNNITPDIAQELAQLLKEGLRVVAVAQKIISVANNADVDLFQTMVEKDCQLIGFCGIQDTIRADVAQTIKQIQDAGLRVVMVTGDHKETALFVAKKVGILTHEDQLIDGTQLNNFSESQLLEKLKTATVFARVSPEQKLLLVTLYQKLGHLVAMTGDGINDVPSLVAADLGIAMGKIGTEVAKQASDMILLDDSLASIIEAIKEGRHIFYVLKRVILYFFTTNMAEVLIVVFGLCFNMPLPLFAAQILWLNLVTDGFFNVALAAEPHEPDLLEFPISHTRNLVEPKTWLKIFYMAFPMGIGSFLVFCSYYKTDLMLARTMTFVTMTMFQWFNAWNCRSETRSVFQLGIFSNKWLVAATGLVFGLQFFILHNLVMQKIFRTVPLNFYQWFIVLTISSSIFFIEELRKLIVRCYSK